MGGIVLDDLAGRAAVMGGTVLGGGGGGSIEFGTSYYTTATSLGRPRLISLDDLNDDDLVVTASGVGAPAAAEQFFKPVDAIRAMTLIQERLDKPIAGIITSENGAGNSVNGWIQSAALNIPVVDAPANGRAHPTGLMGAMGAHRLDNFRSIQAAVGGNPQTGKYVEMVVEGQIHVTANLVRQAAISAGGIVMVARDPLPARYLRDNAAPGALTQAIKIGNAMIAAREGGTQAVITAIVESTGGSIYCSGAVTDLTLNTVGGYDVGRLTIEGDHHADLTFWNEFMTIETDGVRQSTFPDLITLISLNTGTPIQTAEVREGDEVAVLIVPREKLILGRGVLLEETIREAEQAVQKTLYSV